jgi:gliding motility-associated-like protein
MKRIITALFLTLISACCYAQEFTEGFNTPWIAGSGPNTGPPGGWGIYDNGLGMGLQWEQTNPENPEQPPFEGTNAAYIDREGLPAGQQAEDWLVTPRFVMPNNGQVSFYSRLSISGNQNSRFRVLISTNPAQGNLANYTLLQEWTEPQLNPDFNIYTQKFVDIPSSYFGQQVYIAIVMVNNNGDRWLVDDFKVKEKCLTPTGVAIPAESITFTQAQVNWTEAGTATQWEVEIVPVNDPFTGIGRVYTTPPPVTINNLEDSTTYKVRIRAICSSTNKSDWSTQVVFTTDFDAPDNDECSTATLLTVSPTQNCTTATRGTLISATASPQSNSCIGSDDDDVWYTFTATNTKHIITLSNISGGDEDLVHAVYQNDCDALSLRYCSDPNVSNALNLTVGASYKVRVYSKSASQQDISYSICVTTPPPPPVNDECINAINIPVNPTETCVQTVSGTVYSATASPQANACAGNDDDDVWFQFTATNAVHSIKILDITGGTPDLYHVVYSGNDCGNLTQIYCSNPESSVASGLVVGQTYKVRVYSFTGTSGQTTAFKMCVSTPPSPPANDECATATVLTVNPGTECTAVTPGTVLWATASGQANTCNGGDDDDVWFQFTATSTSHTISLLDITGSTTNLNHVVYQGSDCGGLNQLYCSDPNSSRADGLVIGQVYKIRVYTFTPTAGQTTAFNICIGTPPVAPANDNCSNAIVVPVNTGDTCEQTVAGTILSATASPEPNSCNGSDDDDVWYQFTATSTSHIIRLSNIVGSTSDMFHVLYSGNDCGTLQQLYCSDPNTSQAQNLTIGQVYKIRVYSTTATTGQTTTFDVCVATPPPPPANDNCAASITIPVNTGTECSQTVPGTVYSATASPETGTCAGTADDDVWFEFTATATNHDIALTNVTGSTASLVHALYKGDDCGALELLYCSTVNSSRASYLTPGQKYKLRIYSFTDNAGQTSAFDVCVTTPSQPIVTDVTRFTVPELVTEVLVNAGCAQVANLSWKTGNTNGFDSVNGLAYFEKNNSNFPLRRGVVLSTGDAFETRGPNNAELSKGNEAWTGDDQLFEYIRGLNIDPRLESNLNATVLEFDFVPLTDHISFPFVFASEEYGTYQCEFSDSFAFFLTNTVTGETTNLAVLPGTEIPISVVTIRDGANADCGPANPEYYGQNNEGANAFDADINFNGQTVMLTAESDVAVNTVYHIKLVIADRNDELLDSAVFIGPFNIGDIDLGEDLLKETFNALCPGESHLIDTGLDPALYTISWQRNGVTIPGANGPTLTISQEGTYSIQARYISSTCTAVKEVVIEYYTPVNETVANPVNLVKCNLSGTAVFNLEENTAVILAGLTDTDYTVTYHLTNQDATNNASPLDNMYTNTSRVQTIYARIFNNRTGCFGVKSFTITASDVSPDFDIYEECTGDKYILKVVAPGNAFNPDAATYSWTGAGGFTSTNRQIEVTDAGEYTVTILTAEGCELTASRNVTEDPCFVQKGISPNGDGLNENFDLSGLNVKLLTIFNRYGQEVYSLENYINEWYGQNKNGSELPTGTYFYSIESKSGKSTTGWIYINREDK